MPWPRRAMTLLLLISTLAWMLSLRARAWADEAPAPPQPALPSPSPEVVHPTLPLSQGQPAPWTGLLVARHRMELMDAALTALDRCRSDLAHSRADCQAALPQVPAATPPCPSCPEPPPCPSPWPGRLGWGAGGAGVGAIAVLLALLVLHR